MTTLSKYDLLFWGDGTPVKASCLRSADAKEAGFKTLAEAKQMQQEIIDLKSARESLAKITACSIIEVVAYCDEHKIRRSIIKEIARQGVRTPRGILTEVQRREAELEELGRLVADADYMTNTYFWYGMSTGSTRRHYEEEHSHARISWSDNGDEYEASFQVTCSCKHVYVHRDFKKNGKKTNLTAIRNSYLRVRKLFYEE